MNDHDHARCLLALAQDDLKAARVMVDDHENFTDAIFGFHLQQALEKSLKAWLTTMGKVYPKTHELHRLLMLLEESGATIDHWHWITEFNPFAIQYRYDTSQGDAPLDRGGSVTRVGTLLAQVATNIAVGEHQSCPSGLHSNQSVEPSPYNDAGR